MRELQVMQARQGLEEISKKNGLETEIIINDDDSISIKFPKGKRIFPGENLQESFWYASKYLNDEVK